jgi:glycine/D-amino acid oxidase-like deaminating enzyme/nitrite reductase/ring-hydroxylating ferredoxin subunit
MTSLWLDRPALRPADPLTDAYDDVVVGAGITGLVTGLLLARAGRRVAVLDAREVGAGTTGHSTAKLSLLQGTRLSHILERQSRRVAEAYVEANREGQAWLLRFCDDHGVPVQRRDAVTFAGDSEDSLRRARAEHEAAASLGLEVRWVEDLFTPFPCYGGTVLSDQAQFDPLDVLAALVEELRLAGGSVSTGRRMVGCSTSTPLQVSLDDGTTVQCEHLVQATGIPVLDRGLYFAKAEPQRSYALAFAHPDPLPMMMLSAGSPTRSIRDAPGAAGRDRLLVGGEGHVVGRTRSEAGHLDRLREWTAGYFPDAEETHAWSAQDYASHDGVPFVGRMPRGGHRIYVATGFAKWGMTNGVAAARAVSAEILGRPPSWTVPMSRRVTRPSGALQIARINAAVGAHLATGLARAELHAVADVKEGEADIGRRDGMLPTGLSDLDGRRCAVVALCTHLGGVLKWNDAEGSWDCPLHGSRFTPDGAVIEGPATKPLRRRTLDGPA